MGRSGRTPIKNSSTTHFAVKTDDGWALSRPEYAQVSSQLNKVNATTKAKTGKVNDVEIIRTSENEYLIRNNNDGSFDVLDVNNFEHGEPDGKGISPQDWLDELQMHREGIGRQGDHNGRGRNNGRINNTSERRGEALANSGEGTDGVHSSSSGINGQGTAEGVQRKVQIINEVESAIKDSKGNVLGINVDGNKHLNFLRQFICYYLRY